MVPSYYIYDHSVDVFSSCLALLLQWHMTPLQNASYNGRLHIVDALIDAGANIDNCSGSGKFTPFCLAISQGHAAVAYRLAQRGADVNIRNAMVRKLFISMI